MLKINMKATKLIGALVREYEDVETNKQIQLVLNMKILKNEGRTYPSLDWKNMTSMKIISQKWERKRKMPTININNLP